MLYNSLESAETHISCDADKAAIGQLNLRAGQVVHNPSLTSLPQALRNFAQQHRPHSA